MKTTTKARIKRGALTALLLFTAGNVLADDWPLALLALVAAASAWTVPVIGVWIEERREKGKPSATTVTVAAACGLLMACGLLVAVSLPGYWLWLLASLSFSAVFGVPAIRYYWLRRRKPSATASVS